MERYREYRKSRCLARDFLKILEVRPENLSALEQIPAERLMEAASSSGISWRVLSLWYSGWWAMRPNGCDWLIRCNGPGSFLLFMVFPVPRNFPPGRAMTWSGGQPCSLIGKHGPKRPKRRGAPGLGKSRAVDMRGTTVPFTSHHA